MSGKIANKVEVEAEAEAGVVTINKVVVVEAVEAGDTIISITNSITNSINSLCPVHPLARDVNYTLVTSHGRPDGVNSRITSASVVTLTVLRSRKAAMERRRDSDSSASILPRTLQRQWTS